MTDANVEWGKSWGHDREAVPARLPAQCPECRQQGCGLQGSTQHRQTPDGRMEYREIRRCDACGAMWIEVYECRPELSVRLPLDADKRKG